MKTFVLIPTYNEKENIANLINEILKLKIKNMHIVVADDSSPDGTWKIVQGISKKQKNVHLLLRKKDRGRGSAGRDGFIYCLKNKADIIVEMDADFSHNPEYIPIMLKEIKNYDIILGPRVRDCNSGFRCFKSGILKKIEPEKLESKGPSIVQEVLFKAHLKKARIVEIPIVFINRKKGVSKLGIKQLMLAYVMVLKLKLRHLSGLI